MASPSPNVKFSIHQLNRYNDRIRNVLDDQICRNILEYYLRSSKRPALLQVLELWKIADSSSSFDESMFDLIDEIDSFNPNPLLTLSECHQKLGYVKSECSRILECVRPSFIEYLTMHHKTSC